MERVDRIIEVAKKSIIPVSVYYGVISHKGNVLEMTVLKPNQKKRIFRGEGTIKNELKRFPTEYLDAALKKIESENDRYKVAKKRLEEIANLFVADEGLKQRVIKSIERLCTPSRYSYCNQVFLENGVYLKLVDSSMWETEGALHLQKIMSNHGSTYNYPAIPEEKLILELADLVKIKF